jgi:hypothetical protein
MNPIFAILLILTFILGITYLLRKSEMAQRKKEIAGLKTKPINNEKREEILQTEIIRYANKGWKVISRTETTAQLSYNNSPNLGIALILLFFFVLPAILYLIFGRSTENLYLVIDKCGNVNKHWAK